MSLVLGDQHLFVLAFFMSFWKNFFSDFQLIFQSGCLVFYHWVVWAFIYVQHKLLTDHIICKYFLPSVGCLFILSVVSSVLQKLLSLIRSHLFILFYCLVFFFFFALGQIQKTFLQFRSKSSPMVSGFIFRSLNHFEFIFTYGMWQCSNFIVFHVAIQHFHHHLLKRLSFFHVCSRLIYGKLTVNAWDYFWALLSFPLIFVPLCQYCTVLITVVWNIVWRL